MTTKDTFECAIISEPGCEQFVEAEIRDRFNIKEFEKGSEHLKLKVDKKSLLEIVYMSQTANRVILFLTSGEFNGSIEDLTMHIDKKIQEERIKALMLNNSFKIICNRIGDHNFNSVMAEQEVGRVLENKSVDANIKNPDIYIYLGIHNNNFIIGIDLAGKDLSKRQYRVFNHPNNLKGTIAFSAIMFSGYKPGMIIADPFSLSGVIPIEASLYESNRSVNFYDKIFSIQKLFPDMDVTKLLNDIDKRIMKNPSKPNIYSFDSSFNNVSAQKKNAKIAGTEKFISFSRTEGNKTDMKFEDKQIDVIVTKIIEQSKHISENKATKIHQEFFSNIKRTIKESGKIVLIVRDPKHVNNHATDAGFIHEDTVEIKQGKQTLYFIKFSGG